MRIITAIFLMFFALPLAAQELPERENPNVNDFAGILGEDAEGELGETIERLRVDRGVDAVLVTIDRLAAYGDDETIESFATKLYNDWGMGVEGRTDGVMILFARADRGIRVELGPGWDDSANETAQRVINAYFVPDFKRGAFEDGLLVGTKELVSRYYDAAAGDAATATEETAQAESTEQTTETAQAETTTTETAQAETAEAAPEEPAQPAASETPATPASDEGGGFPWIIAAIVAVAGFFGWRMISGGSKCPECGKKGLKVQRNTLKAATVGVAGEEQVITDCPHCSYHNTETRTLAAKSEPKPEAKEAAKPAPKDDGQSKGGGASGSW